MCSNLIDLEPEASPSRTTSAGANISASLASPSQDLPENTVPRATGSSALSSRVTNDDERFSAPAVKKDETDEDKAELIARRREILARRAKNIDKINKKLVEKVPLASSTSGQGPSDNSGAGVNRATPQAAADLALPSETSEDFKAAFLAGLAGVAIRDLEIPWEDLEQGSRIGMGSFGEVRRGQWNGTEVAIKIYHEQNLSADLIKEFKAEVAMMARLVHPNIVMFLGAVIEPGKLAIVTEFVSCGSLFSLLHGQTSTDVKRRNALDSKRRLMLATDISRGMQCELMATT